MRKHCELKPVGCQFKMNSEGLCVNLQNHEKALSLINKLLSQVVALPPSPQSTRDRLATTGVTMAERFVSPMSGGGKCREIGNVLCI